MGRRKLDNNIDVQTRKCLRGCRVKSGGAGMLARFGNLVFMISAVALMVTVVLGVYRLPGSVSTETMIAAGSAINRNEIPELTEVAAWHKLAVLEAGKIKLNEQMRHFANMFNADLQLARLIYDISVDEEVDPELVFRVIRTESRFVTDCVGLVGEIGLMQVRYGTALTIDRGATRKKLYDPAYNIRIGIRHLKDHLHYYRGDIRLALLAFNRGRGRVNELLSLGMDPANGYARRVLDTRL
ncbi:MAG: lytic transglycosylase domain-containing protein [Candidatus Glassbacteria bacterium]|nr:lytic transglycosylase domain-containing protein [Candidatus Glassbacteria bacterium]